MHGHIGDSKGGSSHRLFQLSAGDTPAQYARQ